MVARLDMSHSFVTYINEKTIYFDTREKNMHIEI